MDRDKRWERVKIAADALIKGEGEVLRAKKLPPAWLSIPGEKIKSQDQIISKIEERYKKDETDEFIKPIVIEGDGRIKGTSERV